MNGEDFADHAAWFVRGLEERRARRQRPMPPPPQPDPDLIDLDSLTPTRQDTRHA